MLSRIFLLLLALTADRAALAQQDNTIGIPDIINYTKQTYHAGTQNWGIAQDRQGIMYFANNQGLLSFDGTAWRKYPLPNRTIVRSVLAAPDGRIYVGGQSELGYFAPGTNGELSYTSLIDLLPPQGKDFTDVWNICLYEGHIYFRAYRKILEYDGRSLRVHDGVHWSFLGPSTRGLLAVEYNRGLVRLQGGNWRSVGGRLPQDFNLRTSLPLSADSTLLFTLNHGVYLLIGDSLQPFHTPDLDAVAGRNLYGAIPLAEDRMLVFTNIAGCAVLDRSGRLVQSFTRNEGIQNNNVLSAFLDRDRNIWLGLDNGIDLIRYSNAIRNIFPDGGDRGAGYASFVYRNQLYLGLATGAYRIPLDGARDLSYTRGRFELVEGSKGQVWNFSEVNDQLIMGHNSGAYIIEGSKARVLDNKTGFWDFQPLESARPASMMVAGTYNGINFYDYRSGQFVNPRLHAHFESARFVVRLGNEIWIAHPYKGLYRVRYLPGQTPVATMYKDRKGVLSANHNKIFLVGGQMILTSDKGVFEYDPAAQEFLPSDRFNRLFGQQPVSYLKEDRYGNIWFTQDRKLGLIDRSGTSPRLIYLTELTNRIQADGFDQCNVIDSNNVLVAGEKGYIHIDLAAYRKSQVPLQVAIRNVRSVRQGDSLIFGGYGSMEGSPRLAYRLNALHFECASSVYGQESTIEYSYYLDGFDRDWSEWTRRTEKDYTNLPPGTYVFQVKCRNNFNNESPVARFAFTIEAPWYRTWWAYLAYALIVFGLLYLLYKRQQRRYVRLQQQRLAEQQRKYQEEQQRLQVLHQLELAESEKQITQLRNEKLQAEVAHKNSELASSAMSLVHKMELLSRLKADLLQYRDGVAAEKGARELQKILKLIDAELNGSGDWEQFERHFDSVHTDYLKRLREQFPDLTASELKLAAYLRLNLTTKEIAQLMNISIRGVETSRYRLRKKIGIANEEVNLVDHLIRITS